MSVNFYQTARSHFSENCTLYSVSILFRYCLHDVRKLKVKVILRATVSRPVCLGVRHPSGARDKFFSFFIIFGQLLLC
jgi:hypothetical protein